MVAQTGQGTRAWSAAERAELLNTGRVSGYQGHHINSVNGSPELAGEPNNIGFVKGTAGNLEEHGGNFRNATTGPLMNRTLGALGAIQLITSLLPGVAEAKITGVYEGWSFRGGIPNPEALLIQDPSKAATTLDGQTITVYGAKGATTTYSVHDGNYYQVGSDKPVDPNTLKGKEFEIRLKCSSNPNCA
jgi:hypothetical protein